MIDEDKLKRRMKAYGARPEQKKNRAARNAARRELMKAGLVKKGDGKDVDHKKPISKGGTNARSNLAVKSASANRGHGMTRRPKAKD